MFLHGVCFVWVRFPFPHGGIKPKLSSYLYNMRKQTLLYAGAGAAVIAGVYFLAKKKPVTTVTETPKADPVPPKLSALELNDYNSSWAKMTAWVDSVLPSDSANNATLRRKYEDLWLKANPLRLGAF